MSEPPNKKSRRGFASMSLEQRRDIARRGGKAVSAKKRTFNNPELAASAGQKGGKSVPPEKRSFSTNHQLAREAGRKGGLAPRPSKTSKPKK